MIRKRKPVLSLRVSVLTRSCKQSVIMSKRQLTEEEMVLNNRLLEKKVKVEAALERERTDGRERTEQLKEQLKRENEEKLKALERHNTTEEKRLKKQLLLSNVKLIRFNSSHESTDHTSDHTSDEDSRSSESVLRDVNPNGYDGDRSRDTSDGSVVSEAPTLRLDANSPQAGADVNDSDL